MYAIRLGDDGSELRPLEPPPRPPAGARSSRSAAASRSAPTACPSPFSTALRRLRRELPARLAAAAAGQEEELARLLPELGPAAPETRRDEHGMARLFALTARLLERVAAEHTVVLALEDLHWADASTRHLLAYLFRTLRTGRLVVLATYRSDDIHRRHTLLAELDRLRTVHRVELGRFNREEAGRSFAGILAREPEPDHVDEIFERSDGNAFFIEELAAASPEGCRSGLTDTLRDLLLVRVESLPDASRWSGASPRAAPPSSTGCWPPSPGSPRTTSSAPCAPR
ncbi:hypothetical protein SHIRM173S_06459 [Streptomyces hirsutus]